MLEQWKPICDESRLTVGCLVGHKAAESSVLVVCW